MNTHGSSSLIVVPYIGEFGWELMNWQSRVRWIVEQGRYRRIIVCASPDRRPLYVDRRGDGRVVFCPMPKTDWPGFANNDHRVDDEGRPICDSILRDLLMSRARQVCGNLEIGMDSADFFMPDFRSTMWPTTKSHQQFTSLRLSGPIETDIVLVPRLRRLAEQRNQTEAWWSELAARLQARGLRVATYQPRVDQAIVQLSRTRLAIGASTGGLHLASLCACPHYVWGSGPQRRWTPMQITNRQRYETLWNPLGTPCRYDECGWQPPIEHVMVQACRALDEIGLPVHGADRWGWIKPTWWVKRRLARIMEAGPSPFPWSVRNLVRHHLV